MTVVPYKNNSESKKDQVEQMFNQIAPKYDFLNHFLSLGIDIYWRKKAIKLIKKEYPTKILDIATGTADFAIAASSIDNVDIIGCDISEEMLNVGRSKIKSKSLHKIITLEQGNSENLKYKSDYFDTIMVSFGVRNFENLEKGLSEILRVLQPGKKVFILEFSKPKRFPFKNLYNFYFKNILPTIGKLVSKDSSAYSYLPESVDAFPDGSKFTSIMKKVGFVNNIAIPFTFGVSTLYIGQKA